MGLFDLFRRSNANDLNAMPATPIISPSPWERGYRIRNRWEILDIKRGGMGVVYIVHDHEWDRKFALKTFQDQFLRSESIIQRFMAEAETWTKLERHSNIVFADFVEIIEGRPVLFLEYIEGGDLDRFAGTIRIPDALDFAIQFCTGMEYAYRKLSIIHRDIKPGNVMVQKDARFRSGYCFKVTDFGLVSALGAEPQNTISGVSSGVGTVPFMPPEQFSPADRTRFGYTGIVSTRSDIFAFGVTLYYLLTRELPFPDPLQTFLKSPEHPAKYNPKIPANLDSLILRCLEKNPDMRYADFTVIKEALIELYNGLVREPYVVYGRPEELSNIDWLNRGVALGNLGNYDEALVCIDRSLAMMASEPLAWSDKGYTLTLMNRVPEALGCLDKALFLNPALVSALCRKANAHNKTGNYSEAIRYCDQALRIDPDFDEALNCKGLALGCLQRYHEAMACFDRAIRIYPRHTAVWRNKGGLLGAQGRYQEAGDCFERALSINPRDTDALVARGMCHMSLNRPREALPYFTKALSLKPDHFMAWYSKGTALMALGDLQEAVRCYEKHIELYPPSLLQAGVTATVEQARKIIGELKAKGATAAAPATPKSTAVAAGQLDGAGIDPKVLEAWYKEGISFNGRGQFRQAIDCYDKILKIAPNHAQTWNSKGIALASLGRFSEAIACHDTALGINPKDAHAWDNRGLNFAELGQFAETIRCYDKSLEINPDDALAWHNKGMALARLKRFTEAIASYDRALGIRPDYDLALFNKGAALASLGKPREAVPCFERFIALAPPQYVSHIEKAKQMIRDLRGGNNNSST